MRITCPVLCSAWLVGLGFTLLRHAAPCCTAAMRRYRVEASCLSAATAAAVHVQHHDQHMVSFARMQGPLCRFGDTAANAGVLSVMAEYEATRSLPLGVQTAAASAAAASWRILLLPLDAAKTMMQVRRWFLPVLARNLSCRCLL